MTVLHRSTNDRCKRSEPNLHPLPRLHWFLKRIQLSICLLNTINGLFGDRADEVVLFLPDAIKNPFLRAIMYTRVIEYKEQHKNLFDKTGDSSKS